MLLTCVLSLAVAQVCSSAEFHKHKLNNGREIPTPALGTYLGFGEEGRVRSPEVRDAFLHAINLGYRHIDTAFFYGTENAVGQAVRMAIDGGELNREDLFITTKLWSTHHRREQVVSELRESLKNLDLNYVDLYLMHWPVAINEDHSFCDVDYLETWRGMEDTVRLGLVKAIGVSNFNIDQLKRLLNESTVKPAVLQIEIHPLLVQTELVELARHNGIVVMGHSPLGTIVTRYGIKFTQLTDDNSVLKEIAQKYNKSVPQVILRWLVDRQIVPVVKSINPKRQAENIDIFDFSLTDDEVSKISAFDSNFRLVLPSYWQEHQHYPFEKIANPIRNPFAPKKD